MYQDAKDECSKYKRCVGIEFNETDKNGARKFKLCLDSIYSITAWYNYERNVNQLLKKKDSYGKCSANEAT